MVLLSVNAGSSSLKVSVFDQENLNTPRAAVSIEGIGLANAAFIPSGAYGTDAVREQPIPDTKAATDLIREWLSSELSIQASDISAIGHRVVHGGEKYANAAEIDELLVSYLHSIIPLAPNHMPGTLTAIEAFRQSYPETTHVACFDTSFFHNLPEVATTFPIPLELQRANKIRRYGFHGLSYEFLINDFAKNEGEQAAKGRVIMAHLGSGASVAACKDGQPVESSMGFTPVSGIMMSTRSGDLEPGLTRYLQEQLKMTLKEVSELLTYKSGLLGVSGTTADMYTLLQTQHDNPDVKLAIELFVYKIKKTIGSFAAAMGGVDSIIFSGGIGERSAEIRARICNDLEFLGAAIDDGRNGKSERRISTDNARVGVYVIPTQEDYSIITQTIKIIQNK